MNRPFLENPLFAPLDDLLRRLPGAPCSLEALNGLLAQLRPGARSGGGASLRFVPPPAPDDMGYEARIHRHGAVPTRPDNWHDFFNALVWCAFPRAKAALNARHVEEIARRGAVRLPGRGPVRDALTQFDECGVVVVSSDASLCDLLRAQRWEEAFWHRRGELTQGMRFIVFGHATYDSLRTPFVGLCGKAWYRVVDPDWLAWPLVAQREELDAWLARKVADPACLRQPKALHPLPLLGIPGVTADNGSVEYYRDTRQFRPRAPDRPAVGKAGSRNQGAAHQIC